MSDEQDDNVIHVRFGAAPPEPEPEPVEVPPENHEKLEIFTQMVDRGTVLVTLDARHESVIVPQQFSDEMRLALNFCHQFGIPDFEYDEVGLRASLSFGGVDFYCDIPWQAVYMMRSHIENDVMLFPADVPLEMFAFIQAPGGSEEE